MTRTHNLCLHVPRVQILNIDLCIPTCFAYQRNVLCRRLTTSCAAPSSFDDRLLRKALLLLDFSTNRKLSAGHRRDLQLCALSRRALLESMLLLARQWAFHSVMKQLPSDFFPHFHRCVRIVCFVHRYLRTAAWAFLLFCFRMSCPTITWQLDLIELTLRRLSFEHTWLS